MTAAPEPSTPVETARVFGAAPHTLPLARPGRTTSSPLPENKPRDRGDDSLGWIVVPEGDNDEVLLAEIALTSQQVAAVPARRAKIELLGLRLREAGPAGAAIAVFYLSGELAQR